MSVALQSKLVDEQTSYNRNDCKIGIVHVGYGAFHRAHQAIYIDDYMERTGDLRWGIAAVNLRSEDSIKFHQSRQISDGYIVKTIDNDSTTKLRKVRSHCYFSDWATTPEDAESLLTSPDIHAMTITVTESGYYFDHKGELDVENPVIAAEINGEKARSLYGYLANSLNLRMRTINQPISILCCDNIRFNGKLLKKNFLSYLQATGQHHLYDWVQNNVSLPCSMVDRITPKAEAELQQEIANRFGSENLDPIHAEEFSQWVIEDNFVATIPDLTISGVEIVPNVIPYEEAKIRILNGGHTALAYLGVLAGYTTFDEAIRDDKLRKHFDRFERDEVLPSLQLELPFDEYVYLEKVTARFGNQAIADQLERICADGYSKFQIYIQPTLLSCLTQGIDPKYCYDCIASWYLFARRVKMGVISTPYHEPFWEQLLPLLDEGKEELFSKNRDLWGTLPEKYPRFSTQLISAISQMENSWPA